MLLKSGAETLWSSGTAGKGATHVQMRAGGNLVLVGHRATVWETKTSGHRGARLVVQDDGNLVVYGADNSIVWQSGTVTEWAAATGDRLRATEALFPGASLTAKTRPLTLTLQADGDLVLAREGVPGVGDGHGRKERDERRDAGGRKPRAARAAGDGVGVGGPAVRPARG